MLLSNFRSRIMEHDRNSDIIGSHLVEMPVPLSRAAHAADGNFLRQGVQLQRGACWYMCMYALRAQVSKYLMPRTERFFPSSPSRSSCLRVGIPTLQTRHMSEKGMTDGMDSCVYASLRIW